MMRNGLASKRMLRGVALAATSFALAGCGGGREHAHDHDHSQGHEGGHGGHAHHAPHGGALGMLGNHAFQIEVLPNREEGRIDLYVLDGDAERFVRIEALELEARATAGQREWALTFRAMENEATGETLGSTSHFTVQVEELAGLAEFELSFDRLEMLGQVFEDVRIPYPHGSH